MDTTFAVGDAVRHNDSRTPWVGIVIEVKPTQPYPYYVNWERTPALIEQFKNEFGPFKGVHSVTELRKRQDLGN